ncbi:Oidioi.mRNA.OKI2018_I69.chr2.g7206.t1.cds [Oikopleura dioica]|uniref:Oidioi.mRNA.OKI2018_I69.chr2.g7206.t1.cds n=1 Tax=Oikopleura dioica TaxID=34765 RepID=A0ABN7TBG7_OIKDI|nr:Oidioi.mRNA.OKI2018_I69.chr2.g7206.t1.cds [Oikopleura dioica]
MDTLEKLIFLCVLALGILGMMAYLLKEEKFEAEKTKELHRDLTYKEMQNFEKLFNQDGATYNISEKCSCESQPEKNVQPRYHVHIDLGKCASNRTLIAVDKKNYAIAPVSQRKLLALSHLQERLNQHNSFLL